MSRKHTGLGGRAGRTRIQPKSASEMEAEILKLSQEIIKENKAPKKLQYVRTFPVDPKSGKLGRGRLRMAFPNKSKQDRLDSLMRRLKIEDEKRFEELENKLAKMRGPQGVRRLQLKREISSRASAKVAKTSAEPQSSVSDVGQGEKSYDFHKLDRMASEAENAIDEAKDLIERMNSEMREKPDGSY